MSQGFIDDDEALWLDEDQDVTLITYRRSNQHQQNSSLQQYHGQKLAKIERLSTIRFLPTKERSVKETTAHARDNNRFTMFKPMS